MLAMSFSAVFSQFEKGSKWIGGSLGYSGTATENEPQPSTSKSNNYSISLSPVYSIFNKDNHFTTYTFGYSISSAKTEFNGITNSNVVTHNFALGYSKTRLFPISKKFYASFTRGVAIGYALSNNKYSNSINNTRSNNYNLNLALDMGLMYQFNERFVLTTKINNFFYDNLSYQVNKSNVTGSYETTSKTTRSSVGSSLNGFNLSNLQFSLLYKL